MTPRSGVPGFAVPLRGLLVLLLAAIPASPCRAEPASTADPFAGLDAIDVRLEIREPLDLGGSATPQLFGDTIRFNRFQSSLAQSLGQKLESCGILWDEGAVDEVVIAVFGRLERRPDGPVYVYLVEATVHNSTLSSDRRVAAEPVPLRPVIGVADDAGLEAALTEAAVAIVSDELTCRQ